ncbi:MAG: phosphohistidine phosphatase SixA [Ignavibacteriae bacterium]|nr:MAG: phosphohistidine phosphatase SixA [Ignavibacteriota bacterium]
MRIYLLRHGDASSHSRYSDEERPLTELGNRQAALIGTLLQRLPGGIDVILSSPLKRAQETAALAGSHVKNHQVILCDFLLNGADPQQLFDQLDELHASSVLLVGHEPLMSELISLLISGKKTAEVEMKKCSLALVDISTPILQGAGVLKVLIPVELFT